jgi:hypothetical protein
MTHMGSSYQQAVEREKWLFDKLVLVGKSMAVEHYFSTDDLAGLDSPVFLAGNIEDRAACFDAVVTFVETLSFSDANDRPYNVVVDDKFGDDPNTKPKNLPGVVWEAHEENTAAELLDRLYAMQRNVLYNAGDAGIIEPIPVSIEN